MNPNIMIPKPPASAAPQKAAPSDPSESPELFRELHRQLLGLLPSGIQHYLPLPPFFTGYSCGTLYDWDQYFEAIILAYTGYPLVYIRNGIRIFLSRQESSGLIHRSVPRGGGKTHYKHRSHVKPFLAQEALLAYQTDGELDWLRQEDHYEKLKAYLRYWREDLDPRGAGLSVWKDAEHTGMDNHYERAGDWTPGEHPGFCEGVDLNCYLVREFRAMSRLAEALGYAGDAKEFEALAARRAAAIQRDLWHEEDGFYYDRDANTQQRIPVRYAGGFLPMWAGICTEEQAGRLVNSHLLDPEAFWRPYPVPVLAASEPGYVEGFPEGESTGCCSWRAHTWMPINYMIFHGLRSYGFNETATELMNRSWRMFLRGRFAEYYTSESGIGTGRKPFWGWSALALFMHMEFEAGVSPASLDLRNPAMGLIRKRLDELTR
jgi:putative isomerase